MNSRLPLALRVVRLVPTLPGQVQEDGALLDLDCILAARRLSSVLEQLLGHDLHLDSVHAAHQLGFEDWLALLLPALEASNFAAAVDASCDGHAVDFEGLVAVD